MNTKKRRNSSIMRTTFENKGRATPMEFWVFVKLELYGINLIKPRLSQPPYFSQSGCELSSIISTTITDRKLFSLLQLYQVIIVKRVFYLL